jgi:hypothetical protein
MICLTEGTIETWQVYRLFQGYDTCEGKIKLKMEAPGFN